MFLDLATSGMYRRMSERKQIKKVTDEYSKHFAMIAKDFSGEFWNSVYENAKRYADKKAFLLKK